MGNQIKTSRDLTAWISRSARLAVLQPSERKRLEGDLLAHILKFHPDFDQIMIQRSLDGRRDLDNAESDDLAFVIIDAQDFSCFLHLWGHHLSADARSRVKSWIEKAPKDVPVDEDAVEVLEAFFLKFPIPEALRLPVLRALEEEEELEPSLCATA